MDLRNVINEEDRNFINEAIELCEKGYYRASYLIAFLAGIESLKWKLKEASEISTKLKDAYKTIESKEKNHQAVDDDVIKIAKENCLLTDAEFIKLDYFRTQRNIYSHPYGKKPNAVDCQHIIQSMIDIVLTKNIKFGTDTLDFIVKSITEESIFLADNDNIVEEYVKDLIIRTDETFYNYLFTKLASYYESVPTEKEMLQLCRRTKVSIKTIFNNVTLTKLFSNESIISQFIIEYKKTAILIFANNKSYKLLTEMNQDMIFNLLIQLNKFEDLSEIYYDGGNRCALSGNQLARLKNHLQFKTDYFTLAPFPAELIIKNIINMLESHAWATQNTAIYIYRTKGFLNSLNKCDEEDLVRLGRNILQSSGEDDNGYYSVEARNLLSEIKDDENACFEIKKGIVLECITNERNQIRPKLHHISCVAELYSNLTSKRQKNIEDFINSCINTYDVLNYDWSPLNISEFSNIYSVIQNKLTQTP